MEYFFYCRDRPGTGQVRAATAEAHRTFMGGYADGMIAHGPTLTDDGSAATGSVHVVDLPSLAAAWSFAYDEPNYRAGVYREVLIRGFRNVLGRTMWDFESSGPAAPRYLILGHGWVEPRHARVIEHPGLIAYGPLLSDDHSMWLGTAVLAELADRAAAEAVLNAEEYAEIEVHPWCFGGRPSR